MSLTTRLVPVPCQMAFWYIISPLDDVVTRNHSRHVHLHGPREGLGMTHLYGGLCL